LIRSSGNWLETQLVSQQHRARLTEKAFRYQKKEGTVNVCLPLNFKRQIQQLHEKCCCVPKVDEMSIMEERTKAGKKMWTVEDGILRLSVPFGDVTKSNVREKRSRMIDVSERGVGA
jgi:hypothetical protein